MLCEVAPAAAERRLKGGGGDMEWLVLDSLGNTMSADLFFCIDIRARLFSRVFHVSCFHACEGPGLKYR